MNYNTIMHNITLLTTSYRQQYASLVRLSVVPTRKQKNVDKPKSVWAFLKADLEVASVTIFSPNGQRSRSPDIKTVRKKHTFA